MSNTTGSGMVFPASEFQARVAALADVLGSAGLDGLICTSPESLFYVCGYEGYSYTDQQCLAVQFDPLRTTLIIRDIDAPLANGDAGLACVDDLRPYRYPVDDPGALAWDSIVRPGGKPLKIGIERIPEDSTPPVIPRIEAAVPSWATVVVADNAVGRLRIRKRPAELACMREAAVIAKAALDRAFACLRPGISEIDFASEIEYRLRQSGSQDCAIPTLVESGRRTIAAHSMATAKIIERGEPVRFAFGAVRRRYHVTTYQAAFLGEPSATYRRCYDASREALEMLRGEVAPDRPMRDACLKARKVLEAHGISHGNMGRWGYGVGIAFEPGWGEPYAINEYSPDTFKTGMTFCLHVTMSLAEHGFGFTVGADYLLDESGLQLVNHVPPDLHVSG